jgi:tetratricopeptide (TPR) repeat protein
MFSMHSTFSDSFTERVGALFDELELALRWRRPSILLAVYASEFARKEGEAALSAQLAKLDQHVIAIQINEKSFDVPALVLDHPGREGAVFFISGLRWGGGKGKHNAYRSLNLGREYFVENQTHVVFWLTKQEASDLPRHAPDFWAFRHRVIDFPDLPVRVEALPALEKLFWGTLDAEVLREEADAKIALRENMLANLPEGNESALARVEMIESLAALCWARGDQQRALEFCSQGFALAGSLGDRTMQARLWCGKGLISYSLGQIKEALSAYRKALEINPHNAATWSNLSVALRSAKNLDGALDACQKAIEIDPKPGGRWNNLGNIQRDLGRLDEACASYKRSAKISPGDYAPWENLGHAQIELGRPTDAIRAFHKALKFNPLSAGAWQSLESIYAAQGRARDAAKAHRQAEALLRAEKQFPGSRSAVA